MKVFPVRAASPVLLAILLSVATAQAQEFSEATYLGGLDGAVEACASAFPEQAARYRLAVKQLVGCHLDDAGITAWRSRLRDGASTARQYAQGHADAKRDLGAQPAARRQRCDSLLTLRCDPAAKPASK